MSPALRTSPGICSLLTRYASFLSIVTIALSVEGSTLVTTAETHSCFFESNCAASLALSWDLISCLIDCFALCAATLPNFFVSILISTVPPTLALLEIVFASSIWISLPGFSGIVSTTVFMILTSNLPFSGLISIPIFSLSG